MSHYIAYRSGISADGAADDAELLERQSEVLARAAAELEALERLSKAQTLSLAELLAIVGTLAPEELTPAEVRSAERARKILDGAAEPEPVEDQDDEDEATTTEAADAA